MVRYSFAPGLDLELDAPTLALRHFEREYAPAASATVRRAPAMRATVAWGGESSADGHKTVRWSVGLGAPEADPLELALGLRGRPRSFALSLVQGFLLEPLLSVAAARHGHVLLPAAALAGDGGATVVLGRSRSGKSTAMTLALAAGREVLGDDQVLLDGHGGCRPFPRRLRLYPDLRETAPEAFRRLPPAERRALLARRAARALSRGWVAPSLAVRATAVGPAAPAGPLPVVRLVAVERTGDVAEPASAPLALDAAIDLALTVLDEQRARLAEAGGSPWAPALAVTREREAELLRAALAGAALERLRLPGDWPAPRGVAALAGALGLRPSVSRVVTPRDPEELEATAGPVKAEIAPATTLGPVHLTVADLARSLEFYRRVVGLQGAEDGDGRATLSAGGRPLLVLDEQHGARPAVGYTGLYHYALLVPERTDLARWLAHAARERVPLAGASDHFVSEAIYLSDPDLHGIEIYWDRPRELWEGQVSRMGTWPLDLQDLLATLGDPATAQFDGLAPGTIMGHVHLRVADVPETVAYYRDVLGFGLMAQLGAQAAFLSAGGYHHHFGANTWESRGAPPPPPGTAALRHATVVLPDAAERAAVVERVEGAGHAVEDGWVLRDPSGNRVVLDVAPRGA